MISKESLLILPDSDEFWEVLHGTLPPNWRNNLPWDFRGTFAVDFNTWCLKPIGASEENDYILGGEFDAFDEIKYWWQEDDDCC